MAKFKRLFVKFAPVFVIIFVVGSIFDPEHRAALDISTILIVIVMALIITAGVAAIFSLFEPYTQDIREPKKHERNSKSQ